MLLLRQGALETGLRPCFTARECAVQSFWRRLAILCRLSDGGEERRLDEAEIDMGDPLSHADVCIVRRAWIRGRFAGLHSDIQGDGFVIGFTHAS